MPAKVDQPGRGRGEFDRRAYELVSGSGGRENGAIVNRVGMDVEQSCSRSLDRGAGCGDDLWAAPLGQVRYGEERRLVGDLPHALIRSRRGVLGKRLYARRGARAVAGVIEALP